MGLSPAKYAKRREETRPIVFLSIDHEPEREDGDGPSLHDLLTDQNDVTARDSLEEAELMKFVAQRINELPEHMRKVLAMYYFENMTFDEIAKVFNRTSSRICQIHQEAIGSLRESLRRERNNPE